MLTNDDFSKFKKLIREEVEAEGKNTREELGSEILRTKMELSNQVSALGSRVKNVEIATNNLQKDVTIVKKDVKRLQKDVDGVIYMTNNGSLAVQKRIRTIEGTLKIPSPDFV